MQRLSSQDVEIDENTKLLDVLAGEFEEKNLTTSHDKYGF